MKTIINGNLTEYKNAIKKQGREIDNLIEFTIDNDTTILGNEEINSVSPHYNGDLLKSVMKQLDINSNIDIPIGTEVNYKFGVKVRNDEVEDYTDNYDYIDFGNYIVYSSEKLEDTNSYQLVCYDKMLYAMKDYDTPKLNGTAITYPITIKDYLTALCETIGLSFKNEDENFISEQQYISKEIYLDDENKSLNYLYRDVLDDLAEMTASTICINENDELELRYVDGNSSPYYQYGILESITGKDVLELPNIPTLALRQIDLQFTPTTQLDNPFYIIRSTQLTIYYQGSSFYTNYGGRQYRTESSLGQGIPCRIRVVNNNLTINGRTVVPLITVIANIRVFGNATTEVQITKINMGRTYNLCYDKDTLKVGLITNVPMIEASGYTGDIPTPTLIDEIDKDFLKEDGAGFGELFGPINTITIQRTSDDYSYSISAPSDLPDEQKNEIILMDNTRQESDLKITLANNILNKLYGIKYTKNNYKSTGLGYLDLLDRYNAIIDDKTYPCIMLNDDFQVEAGLEEYIFAGEMTNSKNTYIDSDRSVRINDRTSYRLDKLEEKTKLIGTYSTSETEIGTWKGVPLYRRIFEGDLNSSGTLDNDISVDGTIQRIEGYAYSIYQNWWTIGSHYFSEPQYDTCFTRDSSSFNIKTNGNFANSSYYVIVEYTK